MGGVLLLWRGFLFSSKGCVSDFCIVIVLYWCWLCEVLLGGHYVSCGDFYFIALCFAFVSFALMCFVIFCVCFFCFCFLYALRGLSMLFFYFLVGIGTSLLIIILCASCHAATTTKPSSSPRPLPSLPPPLPKRPPSPHHRHHHRYHILLLLTHCPARESCTARGWWFALRWTEALYVLCSAMHRRIATLTSRWFDVEAKLEGSGDTRVHRSWSIVVRSRVIMVQKIPRRLFFPSRNF